MNFNNEEEYIELIKNKSFNEIKKVFENSQVEIKNLNYFQNTLSYLIKKNYLIDIIKFFIVQRQQLNLDNTDILFLSVEYHSFQITKLLLKYGTAIDNRNKDSKNIIEYLVERNKLDSDILLFILKIKKDASLISIESLYHLLKLRQYKIFEKLFKFRYYDIEYILNLILLSKNKTEISKEQFQNLIYNLDKGIIKINDKTVNGNNSFLVAVKDNNAEIVKLLIDYAKENNIILKINEKDLNCQFSLLIAVHRRNIVIIKLLMKYANENNIILEVNEKNLLGNFPLLIAIENKTIDIIKLLMEYANENNTVLKLNEKNKDNYYPMLCAINKNDIDILRLLISYANEVNIVLEINEKDNEGDYPLLCIIKNKNIEMFKVLLEYIILYFYMQ